MRTTTLTPQPATTEETAVMFYRREKAIGAQAALEEMERVFNEQYPARGMAFTMVHTRSVGSNGCWSACSGSMQSTSSRWWCE
jgi:hypothetical protein